jgi:hypothetical protein
VKQSKRKVELYRVIWRYCCRDDKKHLIHNGTIVY